MRISKQDQLWEYYYDAMELVNTGELPKAEELLQKALDLDGKFVAAHVGTVWVYQQGGYFDGVREFSESGYKQTRKHFSEWPKTLPWGILENRQYLRAISNKAALHQFDGEDDEADKLYRLILKLNPGDNQGIRYLIAGMYAGLSPDDVDDMFDYGNEHQDWSKLEMLVNEQNSKHKFWIAPSDGLGG